MANRHNQCQRCPHTPDMNRCWKCRKTSKWEMAELIQGLTRVYITEHNAHRKGKGKKIYSKEELDYILKLYAELGTVRKVSEYTTINKDKIQRILTIARQQLGSDDHV